MDGTALLRELFTADEYEAVRRHADHLGVSVAEYVARSAAERALERLHLTESLAAGSPHPGKPPIPQWAGELRRAAGSAPALDRFLDTLAHPSGPATPSDSG
ncbi:hypothetical protein GTW43_37325 [Streptomyces sp. SID5785]|uniref:hypothetical protein n=1 Tax=Streptomyces sp. SID5785 TaxID=2690309 RepID=UPI0013611208|nr:hypothetical protein [Streptomyces sp. SID5785]MZD10698.1 hypothetical protein [Streptomyces sp. SID5785]